MIPVTMLGGYLGAGKTTMVNRLLAEPNGERIVVLVNDVGSVNVDVALIAAHDGETIALSNGCVCCAIADDLGRALERVRELAAGPKPPDRVVIELSGVAEPARVAPWANTTGFRLDGIVVLADAEQLVELAARRFVGDTIRTQLASADLVLITKCDLVADRGDGAYRFAIAVTGAPVHRCGEVSPPALFGVASTMWPVTDGAHREHLRPEPASAAQGPFGTGSTGTGPDHTVSTLDVRGLDRERLATVVASLPPDVIRAKGIVRVTGSEAPVEVHVVGRRRELRDRPDLPTTVAGTDLVLIGVPRALV